MKNKTGKMSELYGLDSNDFNTCSFYPFKYHRGVEASSTNGKFVANIVLRSIKWYRFGAVNQLQLTLTIVREFNRRLFSADS